MRMRYLLVIVVAVGVAAVLGFVLPRERPPSAEAIVEPVDAPDHAGAPHAGAEGGEQATIRGQVLESIDVPGYTYLRVGAPGSEGTWTAVASPAGVSEGDAVAVVAETRMTDFPSKTLDRTFPSIYFGALEGASPPGGAGDHPREEGPAAAPSVEAGSLPRAEGDAGVRIADLHARRAELAGRTVRVRGRVVKRVPGVMGRTFVHLRDGTGDAARKDHDLTVTMTETPEVGDTLLVEGALTVDKDFGSGYQYDVIIEDARPVTP
jgi:hypothetical protein